MTKSEISIKNGSGQPWVKTSERCGVLVAMGNIPMNFCLKRSVICHMGTKSTLDLGIVCVKITQTQLQHRSHFTTQIGSRTWGRVRKRQRVWGLPFYTNLQNWRFPFVIEVDFVPIQFESIDCSKYTHLLVTIYVKYSFLLCAKAQNYRI